MNYYKKSLSISLSSTVLFGILWFVLNNLERLNETLLLSFFTILFFLCLFLFDVKKTMFYYVCLILLVTALLIGHLFLNNQGLIVVFIALSLLLMVQFDRPFNFILSLSLGFLNLFILSYPHFSWQTFLIYLFIWVIAFQMIFLIKKAYDNENVLHKIQNELAISHSQLEKTQSSLLLAYGKLESKTIEKERALISKNMHDTVGHNLTTALVELEVSKLNIGKDDKITLDKLVGATQLVRKALKDLRVSVRALREDIDYIKEINVLIDNAITHADLSIHTHFYRLEFIPKKALSTLYRMIQESLTNGIRHGKAKSFNYNIHYENHILTVDLSNDGVGPTILNKGFGLRSMEERVEELGGILNFKYGPSIGFMIHAKIPIKEA